MSSHPTDKSRFETAADQTRDRMRHAFSGARPVLDGVGRGLGGIRRWAGDHLPGGERTLWIPVGLLLLVLFIWAIMPGYDYGSHGGGNFGAPQPVGVAAAKRGDIRITLNGLGTVTPLATVTVRPQVSGQLIRINFTEGQMVQAGDVLAEIDPRPFQATLDQARGQLARDQASLANAEVDLKRDEALYAQKAVSQQTYDTQKALVLQDRGVVESDKANVEAAAINLGYTRITAPVSGRAGLRQVDVGNFVSAGQTNGIVVVTELQPISVLFTIPEDNVDQVMARMKAGTLTADAYDRTQTTKLASGTLAAMDSQIDTTTGTVKMRAMFDNADGMLFPNQFVNIHLLVNTLHNQVVIPDSAIERGSQGTFVFVVKPDDTVAMRTVTLGPQDGSIIAVTKGLNPGETVVTDGADQLSDGATITIPSGQKVAAVQAAANATPVAASSNQSRRAQMMQLFRKMTPAERQALRGMSRDGRRQWLNDHRQELMKRKDQPFSGFRHRPQ